ncbi:MAG: hypothetical protein GY797_06150 [Deltaproteobacteria bacterium]|nr:hypothetical protein [Deltaproteobacteria bacterium]
MSKHYDRQIKMLDNLKGRLMGIHNRAHSEEIPFHRYLALKTLYIHESDEYGKLTDKNRACLEGYSSAMFDNIQMNLTKWLMYYTNKNGKVIYVKKWQRLPQYIKDSGNFNGNHFWIPKKGIKRSPDKGPQPFGNTPSTGVGMK